MERSNLHWLLHLRETFYDRGTIPRFFPAESNCYEDRRTHISNLTFGSFKLDNVQFWYQVTWSSGAFEYFGGKVLHPSDPGISVRGTGGNSGSLRSRPAFRPRTPLEHGGDPAFFAFSPNLLTNALHSDENISPRKARPRAYIPGGR